MTVTDTFVPQWDSPKLPREGATISAALDSCHAGIIAELRQRAGQQEPWHLALLNAMGQWSLTHEFAAGRSWRYVIGGEALDGLTLAQRLCLEIPDVVPPYELESLLFRGLWPERMGPDYIRQLIGAYRYTALLNFRYGVVVEEALQLVAEESIRKSRFARCYQDTDEVVQDAYRHLYGAAQTTLLSEFLQAHDDAGTCAPESISLTEWQEFTYWLFKRRVHKWHPARVASDTRRGLERLRELHDISEDHASLHFAGGDFEPPLALTGRP